MLDPELSQIHHPIHRMDDVDHCPRFRECLHDGGHEAFAALRITRQQKSDAQSLHRSHFTTASLCDSQSGLDRDESSLFDPHDDVALLERTRTMRDDERRPAEGERPEVLDQLAQTFQILIDEGLPRLTIEALWIGDTPRETVKVTAAEFVRLARSSRLGTRTRYELAAENEP